MRRRVRVVALASALAVGGCGKLEGVTAPSGSDAGGLPPGPDLDGAAPEAGSEAGPSEPYRDAVMSDGPIAYWRLGEAGGIAAKDEMGHADGVYSGGCTFGVAGAVQGNTAVKFNDDQMCMVDVSSYTGFELAGTSPYSIEAWVNVPAGTTGIKHIFTHQQRAAGPTAGYALVADSAAVYAERVGNGTNEKTQETMFTASVWVHVVAVYQPDSLVVYVNGVAGPTTTTHGSVTAFDVPHTIIGATGGNTNFFFGGIDEVAIYGKALTSDRVKAHFTAR